MTTKRSKSNSSNPKDKSFFLIRTIFLALIGLLFLGGGFLYLIFVVKDYVNIINDDDNIEDTHENLVQKEDFFPENIEEHYIYDNGTFTVYIPTNPSTEFVYLAELQFSEEPEVRFPVVDKVWPRTELKSDGINIYLQSVFESRNISLNDPKLVTENDQFGQVYRVSIRDDIYYSNNVSLNESCKRFDETIPSPCGREYLQSSDDSGENVSVYFQCNESDTEFCDEIVKSLRVRYVMK